MRAQVIRPFDPTRIPKPRIWIPFQVPPKMPLDLEIGCGVGWHPISYAQKNPDRFLIAIEHTAEKFGKFHRRYERHEKPSHLLPVHANAISWVTYQLPPNCLERVFLLYPNPTDYWYEMPFFGRLQECMKPRATLTLATNLPEYAKSARQQITQEWKMKIIDESSPIEPRTHFEKKYLKSGQKCYNLIFEKH